MILNHDKCSTKTTKYDMQHVFFESGEAMGLDFHHFPSCLVSLTSKVIGRPCVHSWDILEDNMMQLDIQSTIYSP